MIANLLKRNKKRKKHKEIIKGKKTKKMRRISKKVQWIKKKNKQESRNFGLGDKFRPNKSKSSINPAASAGVNIIFFASKNAVVMTKYHLVFL